MSSPPQADRLRKPMRKLAILSLLLLTGCGVISKKPVRHIAESPTISVQDGNVEISGDSKIQPKVDTKQTGSHFVVPKDSKVEYNEKSGVLSVVMAKDSEIVVRKTETAVQGPVAFTPDKGVTVQDEKAAQADFWTVLGLRMGVAVGIAAGLFGLIRNWNLVMYGGAAVAGACLFGLFVQKHPILLIIIGLGVAIAVAGPILWHTKIKKLQPDKPDV